MSDELKMMELGQMRMCPIKESVLIDAGCKFVQPSEYRDEEFTFTYLSGPFDLAKIDHKKSKEVAQNRVNGKLTEESVNRYMVSMRSGDIFPAPVLFKNLDDLLDELYLKGDGFHTLEALIRLGGKFIYGVYLFSHPNALEVSGRFNARTNGVGESLEETLEKAVRLYKMKQKQEALGGEKAPTRKEHAAYYRLGEETFNRQMRVTEAREFLARKDVAFNNIRHVGSFDSIHGLSKYDESAAIKTAELANRYSLDASSVKQIITGFMDGSKSSEEKKNFLTNVEIDLRRRTNNGTTRAKTKGKNRSLDLRIKDAINKIAIDAKKAIPSDLQKLLADSTFKENSVSLRDFLNVILK